MVRRKMKVGDDDDAVLCCVAFSRAVVAGKQGKGLNPWKRKNKIIDAVVTTTRMGITGTRTVM